MLRRKCSFSTIGIQQRHLRAIVNIARFRGIVKEIDYPFGRSIHNKYQIPTAKTSKRPLEEFELIRNHKLPAHRRRSLGARHMVVQLLLQWDEYGGYI